MRILFEPGNDGGGGASAVAAADSNPDADVMDSVLNKLGLPKELKGEKGNSTGDNGGNGEPTAEEKAAQVEAARIAGLTPDERAAEEAQVAEAALIENLTEEERTALEGMSPEDRAAELQRLADLAAETAALPEFTPEQQAWVDQQTATVQEELAAVRTEADQAKAEVERLTGELQTQTAAPAAVADIHPLFLQDVPSKIDEMDAQMASFERWALANWDGTEEVPAEGTKPGIPAYSGAQIRERYAAVKEVREKLVPAAKQAIGIRNQWQARAKQEYPELFDAKRSEAKVAESILKQAPGLKAIFPNIHLIIGDALVGEKIRLAKAKAKAGSAKRGAGSQANGKPIVKVPPKIAPKPAGARVAANGRPKVEQPITAKKFRELGGDRNALITMLKTADLPVETK